MVWYIPPLSPVVDAVSRDGHDGEDIGNLFGALEAPASRSSTWPGCSPPARPPLSKGCSGGWRRCAPICATSTSAGRLNPHSRVGGADRRADVQHVPAAGAREIRGALCHSTAYADAEPRSMEEPGCSLSFEGGPGMYVSRPFGEGGRPVPVAVESFPRCGTARPRGHGRQRNQTAQVNLLNWDGRGAPAGMFPGSEGRNEVVLPRADGAERPGGLAMRLAGVELSRPPPFRRRGRIARTRRGELPGNIFRRRCPPSRRSMTGRLPS